jgi:predicted NBD/HSP70 family sugar kinase
MQFYTGQHQYYCGIDLHARTMYVCVIDSNGAIIAHRNMASAPEPFLTFIAPYQASIVSSASNASSPGTGLPAFARENSWPSCLATPCT